MSDTPDWMADAACAAPEVPTSLFFASPNEPNFYRRQASAVAVCRSCPVIDECLDHALAVPERHGVWGGRNERQRAAMRSARTRRAS